MTFKSLVAFVALLLAPAAHAQGEQPMEFHTRKVCQEQTCKTIVLASGVFTHETFDRFVAHVQTLEKEPDFIVLSSSGGNLGQALKMGVLIRALGLSTRVVKGTDCFSACVYAFMGGTSRTVDLGARMGVHQFAPESEEFKITVEEAQEVIDGVTLYTQSMNVSEHLGSLASMATPDQINLLTHSQVRMLRLDNAFQELAVVQLMEEGREIRISGASLGTDRQAQFSIRALPGQPGMLSIVSTFVEPGLYPRLVMEKSMENPGKMMVCPAPDMRISSSKCLFVPALVKFTRHAEGVYVAGFSMAARDLALVMNRASHITLAAGPDGHAPIVSLVLEAHALPETILEMGSH